MKFLYLFSLLLISFSSCQESTTENISPEPGISLELAEFRKKQISDIVYKLEFKIPKNLEDSIPAVLELDLIIHDNSQPLILDFNVDKSHLKTIKTNGKEVSIQLVNEHIIIPKEHLNKGANTIDINFIAGEQSLNRNLDFLYTLLVPDRASTLFPCFDQPNLKANYILNITAPKDWEVLCGAPELKKIEKGDFIEHQFDKSDLMSTYLFSFVAGKFNVDKQKIANLDMTMLYRETDSIKVKNSLDPIFKLHAVAVAFLENYTAQDFPFVKLDFASIPIFQYGGMEHVGAIQYKESSLFLDNTATDSDKLGRAKLIAHETAHMWFGDLVTMNWFNDVWMKEVFANFMADKIVNPAFPTINHDLVFVVNHYPGAYGEDRTKGANPIRQKLDNLKNAGSLYGGIIYHKAPIMMRQLELATGKDKFKEGIQEYIKNYANSNAVWNNLVSILDNKTAIDLKEWSDVWVNQSSRPVFTEQVIYDDQEKISSFILKQSAEDKSTKIWPQTFEIGLVYADSTHRITANVTNAQLELEEVKGLPKPLQIIYNYDGMGYGIFPQQKDALLNIPEIKDEVARGYSYINTYENLLNGSIDPIAAFNLFKKGIETERNELILGRITSQMNSLYWTYFTGEQRDAHQKELENLVYQQLQKELPANIKKTLFGLFSSIAHSETGKEKLFKIWSKKVNIKDLKLNQDDYTSMAMNLAVFEHSKTDLILKETEAEITNPDKKKRFIFLKPALSTDSAVRNSFFDTFKDAKNREKESWVVSALHYINHPLRQDAGEINLKASLNLLEEIQRTGDIFFPKNWLNATIGKYSSKKAFEIREEFLAAHPNLNPVLRSKLLQATDDLDRINNLDNSKDD